MNALSIGTVVAATMACMTAMVTWRVSRDNSTLGSPGIALGVGLLSFLGLRCLPEGLANTILVGYAALAIAILFLLLFMAFQTARRPQHFDDSVKPDERQIRRTPAPRDDLASQSSDVQRPRNNRQRATRDEDVVP